MNISETSWPIVIKHLEHYWGGGLAALGFGMDRIRTLVSIATGSSHRVILGENLVTTLAPSFFIGSLFLQVTTTTIKSWMGSKFGKTRPGTYELAALERLGKSPYTYNGSYVVTTLVLSIFELIIFILADKKDNYNGRNVVTTLVPSLLDGSSSFLQVTRPCNHKSLGEFAFGKNQSLTSDISKASKGACVE